MSYAAILFDLDGTLVHTIDLYGDAVCDMFASAGVRLPRRAFRASYIAGLTLREWLLTHGVSEEKMQALRPLRDEQYAKLLREKVEWIDGAENLLAALKETHPLGLVTGSWKSYVDAIDARLPVSKHFQTVVTADDMGDFMKPHPHGLLLAADRLRVEPERCLYVGDQLFDVEAAKSAGMTSCCVRGTYTPDAALRRADIACATLGEVMEIING